MSELKIIKESAWEHQTVDGNIEIHTQSFRNLANFKFYPERLKDAPNEETKAFREACLAHSKLYLNAHNTYNKCSLLPSELLERNNELLEALKDVLEINPIAREHIAERFFERIQELINKSTP